MDISVTTDHLLDRLAGRIRRHPEGLAHRFIMDTAGTVLLLHWGELGRRIGQALEAYHRAGLRAGDRVVLILPTGPDYVAALLAAFWGGLVPSTLYPFATGKANGVLADEWRALVATLAPAAIVTASPAADMGLPVLDPATFAANGDAPLPPPAPADKGGPAYIQFSSGTTGQAKGLVLSWRAIHANLAAMATALPMTGDDHILSWLPPYHDMGLFGAILLPLSVGADATLMDTSLFVANPLLWFRSISAERPTFTVGPPSAVQTCIDLLQRNRGANLDLSSLRHFVCGAEMVSPRLVENARQALGPLGLGEGVLRPVYGMGEATLAVTFPPPGRPPRIDVVDHKRFSAEGIATSPEDGTNDAWVSVGMPLDGFSLAIASADSDSPLPERRVGRVLIDGESLLSGVFSGGTFHPRSPGWFDTGDLGYLADGELYVTGRSKDIIIKGGRNYAPERIEDLACMTEGVRRAVAFGVYDDALSTERVVVAVEAKARHAATAELRDRLRMDVRAALHEAGYLIDRVVIADKGKLARTTSGKLRRFRCRDLYLAGQLAAAPATAGPP